MSVYTQSLRDLLHRVLPPDGRPIHWRGLLALAEEFAPRSIVRAELYSLLHAELKVQWGGPQGARWVARQPALSAVLAVECPACGAPPGRPCNAVRSPGRLTSRPHDVRQEHAVPTPHPLKETTR